MLRLFLNAMKKKGSKSDRIELIETTKDKRTRLREAWEADDIETFRQVLQEDGDGTGVYGDEGAILNIITRANDRDGKLYTEAILQSNPGLKDIVFGKDCAIHLAAFHGNFRVLEALIAANADVNKPDKRNNAPLHVVISTRWSEYAKHKQCLLCLLKHPDIQINCTNKYGEVPIQLAARKGNREAVEIIIKEKGSLLDLDNSTIKYYGSPRELIIKRFPEFMSLLPPPLNYEM